MMRGGFDPSQVRQGTLSGQSLTPQPGFFGNVKAAFTEDTLGAGGGDTGFFEGLNKAFNPNQIKNAGIPAAETAKETAMSAMKQKFPNATASELMAEGARAYKAALPSALQRYAPIAATGLGIMALGGGFEQEELAPPPGFEDMAAGISPGMKLLEEQPEKYGLNFGGVSTSTVGERYNPYRFIPQFAPQAVRSAARGGSMDKEFPRKNGPINGPGTGTSDNIPAMLSDGEFVFTAKAVRGMGDGSRRAGAKKMYALMKKLEGRTNG